MPRITKGSRWFIISVITLAFCASCLTHQEVAPPTPLMQAAREGDLLAVQHLLERGADVNEQLGLVSKFGAPGFSLESSPDLRHGQTALMEAVETNRNEVVRALLEHGARTSLVKSDKWRDVWTLVTFFSSDGTPDATVLELLIKHADKPLTPQQANELLNEAARVGNTIAVTKLLPYVVEQLQNDPMCVSRLFCSTLMNPYSTSSLISTFELLRPLANTIPPHAIDCFMANTVNLARLSYMLDHGMDPNNQGGMRPLSWLLVVQSHPSATKLSQEQREMLALLLKHGADPRLSESSAEISRPSAIERARIINWPDLSELFSPYDQASSTRQ
jgi:Ankyrin repeats (3 copies)